MIIENLSMFKVTKSKKFQRVEIPYANLQKHAIIFNIADQKRVIESEYDLLKLLYDNTIRGFLYEKNGYYEIFQLPNSPTFDKKRDLKTYVDTSRGFNELNDINVKGKISELKLLVKSINNRIDSVNSMDDITSKITRAIQNPVAVLINNESNNKTKIRKRSKKINGNQTRSQIRSKENGSDINCLINIDDLPNRGKVKKSKIELFSKKKNKKRNQAVRNYFK